MKKINLIATLAAACLTAISAIAQPGKPAPQPPKPAPTQPAKPKPKEILPAVQVYFDLNKAVIKKGEAEKLDKLMEDLKSKSDYTVLLTGHTDSLGNSEFNLQLSEKRVNAVFEYLLDKGLDQNIMEKSYFGESKPREQNVDEEKRQKNRRVEITIFYKEKPKPEPPKPVVDTCKYDTLISMGNGVMMRMNICAYKTYMVKNKNCIKVNVTQGVDAIMNSEYPVKNAKMQSMMFAGIVKIRTCGDTCMDDKATVIVPIELECYKKAKISLWENKGKGSWESSKGDRPNIVKDKKTMSVEFPVRCSSTIAIAGSYTGKYKTKFKVKGANIETLYVTSECPTMIIPARRNGNRWEIVYDKLSSDAKIYAKTDDGKTYQVQGVSLGDVKHGFTFSKPKDGRIYKKYKLTNRNLGLDN